MATKKTTDTAATEAVALTDVDITEVNSPEVVTTPETSYIKEQIIKSKRYSKHIDILNTILGNRKYTFTEVDSLLKEFLNKEVD